MTNYHNAEPTAFSEDALNAFYRSVGGKPIFLGGETVWNFGRIPPEALTVEEKQADTKFKKKIKKFKLEGEREGDDESQPAGPLLLWHHDMVKKAVGFEFNGVWQAVGSCVGAGGGNVLFSLMAAEVIRLKQAEKIVVPFWPLTWGKSRERAGMNNRGDGSLGSAFAEAARLDGVVDAKANGLPIFKEREPGWLWWGDDAELDWSQGRKMPKDWLAEAKKQIVKTTASCSGHEDVKEAIRNYYPVTCASMWGMSSPRSARVQDGMLTAKRSGSWSHQMSIQLHVNKNGKDWYFMMNQWGPGTYGQVDPLTGHFGGIWIDEGEMDWICRDEVFAFSQFEGFKADFLDPGDIV